MNRYDALLHRKSTRRYAAETVPADTLRQVREQQRPVNLLFPEAPLSVEVVEEGDRVSRGFVGGLGKNKAPHFIVLSGKPAPGLRTNAGFVGERMIISLTERGLATCWQGGPVKQAALPGLIDTDHGHELAAIIAFGKPVSPTDYLRPDPNRIARKPLHDLMLDNTLDQHWRPLLEAARIAPSALNGQPWRFVSDSGALHCFIKPPGSFVTRKFLGAIREVDAGIAVCHLAEAAAHHGRSVAFKQLPGIEREGFMYVISMREKEAHPSS